MGHSLIFWTLALVQFILPLCISLDQASFYGGSYISIPLKEAKSSTDIHFKFRTRMSNALILLVAGSTDHCIIRLENGRLKININLGAGEAEVITPPNLILNDLKWHEVFLIRKEANISLIIDNIHTIKKRLPGKFFELNIHHGLFIGGTGNFTEFFYGHVDNFRGCLAEVMYNGISVLDQARHRQYQGTGVTNTVATVNGVTWNCAAEFEAKANKSISFVEDGSFIAISSSSLYSLKLSLEMRTHLKQAVLIYNAGQLSKADLFAVEISSGKLHVILKHSNKLIELLSEDEISDGQWQKVFLKITTTLLELRVNDWQKSVKLPRGHVIEFSEVFYIGGIENSKRSRAMTKGLTTADVSFKGCLRHLSMSDVPKGLPDVHISQGVLAGCVWQYSYSYSCLNEAQTCEQGDCSQECLCKDGNCTMKGKDKTDNSKVISRMNLANDLELLALEALQVFEGQNVLIATSNLHVILDYPKYGIKDFGVKFYLVNSPAHGSVTIDVWPHEKNSFTLAEVAKDKVHYVHDGSESTRDQLDLELEFSTADSYILPAYLQGRFKFSLMVNVAPINDPPTLHIPTTAVLRVPQNGKKILLGDLLKVVDPDTPDDKIVINVLDAGSCHLELSKKPGTAISSFSKQDLDLGRIVVVHRGGIKNNTYLSLQVSDGIELSPMAKLRVSVFPQFWHLQNNTGLVLMHQTYAVITTSNLSFVSNVESSTDSSQFTIVEGPRYGLVEVEREQDQWENCTLFLSEDVRQRRVRYRHLIGRPEFDEFQFRTSLNSSQLFTFRMTFVKCNLERINSKILTLNESWEGILRNDHLMYQTSPVASPTTNIRYFITKPPQYGYFFLSVSKYRLRKQDAFSQEDIAQENLSYKLFRKSYSYIFDTSLLTVTTAGCKNITANITIVYRPIIENNSKVEIMLKRLEVDEGSTVNIRETHFKIYSDFLTELVFNITETPAHGSLQVARKNGIIRNDTTYFTSTELRNNEVFYVHDDSESTKDHFRFMALSWSEEENFEYVETFHLDIILKNDNSPVRVVDKILHVVVGGQRLITGDDLKYSDMDLNTMPKDIVYNCRDVPNGEIFNRQSNLKVEEFTQEDLNNGLIVFRHRGAEYGKVQLWITDGQFYINGILEVQASAPFIRVVTGKKLIVQQEHSANLTTQNLMYETNLFATDDDVRYEVVSKPQFGKLVDGVNSNEVKWFTQTEIRKGHISYYNHLSGASADEFEVRVRCRDAVNMAQLGIWILPAVYWEPLQVKMAQSQLLVEESTSALIDKTILEVFQRDVPTSAIIYHIAEYPYNGYISILSSTIGAQDDSSNVRTFTQSLINENRIIYVQSMANQTRDQIVFNVTNGIVWLNGLTLDIQIIPDRMYLGGNALTVYEGGSVLISSFHLFVSTDYYKTRINEYVIVEQPKHGCLQVHKRCMKLQRFSHKELTAGVVHYLHDGSENLEDSFVLFGVAGLKKSAPLTLNVHILPVNDQSPRLVNNTGLTMFEGGISVISHCMLGAADADRPKEALRFQITGCWWGNITLESDPHTSLHIFTQELVNKEMVVFRHQNGSEAKFTFNVTDGIHTTKEHTFNIRTRPVQMSLNQKPLHIFPLQKKYITSAHLTLSISDRVRPVTFEIVTPPTLGRLMMQSQLQTEGEPIYKLINFFTKEQLDNNQLFYEHTHPFADLYANDSFKFNVRAHLTKPLVNKVMKIDISVSSGGLDAYVNIPKISLDEGSLTNIPLNLSGVVSFLENHAGLRSPVIHASALQPQHGQIFLHQNRTAILTFTQQQIEEGQVYYQHDHSDSLADNLHFSLYLIPGYIMLCNITVPVVINPINDQPFKLVTPAPNIVVVQGENHTISKNELCTEDADSPPDQLIYDIISGPSEGKLILKPNIESISRFTQADINEGKFIYIHEGSKLTDIFNFRVWDNGKFSRPEYYVFNIRALPINLKVQTGIPVYLQQGSNVALLSVKQFIVETNANREKIKYVIKETPKHGVIYVNDNESGVFNQQQLESESVMYMQTDMTTANDSLRVFVGIDRLNLSTPIGFEVDVSIKVQPLMQLANFTVIAGESNKISGEVLDAGPLAKLTNSNPRFTILQPPLFGEVRKIIRSSGERRNVLNMSVTSFTHEEVKSGLIYIVVRDMDVGWDGLNDRIVFQLSASIFQPAQGEFNILIRSSALDNDIDVDSTLAGPNDPAGHEGGMHFASPNMTRDYFLIVSMVAGVIILGVAVIIIIKCRSFEPDEMQMSKEDQSLEPMTLPMPTMLPLPLPRPPDRLMTASPPLKHAQDGLAPTPAPVPTTLPHCKVTPLSRNADSDLHPHARYPYGVDEHSDDWSSCEASDPSGPTRNNIMLRRNQYWV